MDKILGVMEDIKQKITDNEYKIISSIDIEDID